MTINETEKQYSLTSGASFVLFCFFSLSFLGAGECVIIAIEKATGQREFALCSFVLKVHYYSKKRLSQRKTIKSLRWPILSPKFPCGMFFYPQCLFLPQKGCALYWQGFKFEAYFWQTVIFGEVVCEVQYFFLVRSSGWHNILISPLQECHKQRFIVLGITRSSLVIWSTNILNVKGCSGTMPKTKPFFWFLFSTTVTVGMLKFHNFHYLLLIFFFAKFLSFLFIIQPTKIQVKNFGGLN